jgi:hypothetical protein
MAEKTYAVVWRNGEAIHSGRLELVRDHLELRGREAELSVRLADVRSTAIARDVASRLRGLPALTLTLAGGALLQIASLDTAGALRELLDRLGAVA